MKTRYKVASSFSAIALASCGLIAAQSMSYASECVGANSVKVVREYQSPEMPEQQEVSMDSCKAQDLIDHLQKFEEGTNLAGTITSWIPVAGEIAGGLSLWAWGNKGLLKKCAAPGTGIQFLTSQGGVYGCEAQ